MPRMRIPGDGADRGLLLLPAVRDDKRMLVGDRNGSGNCCLFAVFAFVLALVAAIAVGEARIQARSRGIVADRLEDCRAGRDICCSLAEDLLGGR